MVTLTIDAWMVQMSIEVLAILFGALYVVLFGGFIAVYVKLSAAFDTIQDQREKAANDLNAHLDAITDKQASIQGALEAMRTQSTEQKETLERLTFQLEGPQSRRRPS